ncbi:hypothetical protein [Burkholderia diffusa]|nr:hypothetical protein [Burkholderia diffusa]KAB0654494.1 hypothetical protein F7R23_18255 [Burkholderia diffusa]MBM2655050.1 hypothetical protein [Burkholderia diffusa]
MTWSYVYLSSRATHIESQTVFEIEFARNIQSSADLTIRPLAGSKKKFSTAELKILRDELWENHLGERRRNEMRCLVENDFSGDRQQVATIISELTAKNVSVRSIQAWLIEPGKPSSRQCPEWALKALHDYTCRPENEQRLRARREYKAGQPLAIKRTSLDVYDKYAVDMATNQIEADQHKRDSWRNLPYGEIPDKLFELENRLTGHLHYLQTQLVAISIALRTCESFDEFKQKVLEDIDNQTSEDYFVREARRAIESRTDEFSNVEGLLNK